jgi:Tfp pilus assembly protein PilN
VDATVNRINYLGATRPAGFAFKPRGVTLDNRLRGPLGALIASVTLVAVLGFVQLTRLHTAQDRYAAASIGLLTDEFALRETAALRARIVREAQLIDYVGGLQRTTLASANELTWIGNRLPAHTYLRALRFENGTYTLEGTADHPAAVGAAMLALRDAGHGTLPQLVSLRDDGGTAPGRVRYTLRVQTQP